MTPTAGETEKKPTHHVTLSDGTDTVGLMLAKGDGRWDPLGIRRSPYPRMSTKIAQGDGKYSDMEPPYYPIVQDNWAGGRGSNVLGDDTTRFLDSYRAWTDTEKQIVLGGQETYCTGRRALSQFFPGMTNPNGEIANNFSWQALYSTSRYIGSPFTPAANMTASKITLWIRRVGPGTDCGDLSVKIYSAGAGVPNAVVATGTAITVTDIPDTTSQVRETAVSYALTGSTTYWVVAYGGASSTATDHWEVGYTTDPLDPSTMSRSSDGSSWSTTGAQSMFLRVIDNTNVSGRFFEYKGSEYFIETDNSPSATGSRIYINGDRGVPTTVAATVLTDTAKTWTTDEWIGATLVAYAGTGTYSKRYYYTITDSSANTVTISGADLTTVFTAATTEYAIIGTNKWNLLTTALGAGIYCRDLAVAGDYVYIATESSAGAIAVYRYNERNVGGTWTPTLTAEGQVQAARLLSMFTPEGWLLYGAENENAKRGTCVWSARVPPRYGASGDLYKEVQVIAPTDEAWDQTPVTNVTNPYQLYGDLYMSIAAGFTTGVIATKKIAESNLMKGDRIGMLIMSSIATNAGEIQFGVDDTDYMGRNETPANVFMRSAGKPAKMWEANYYKRPSAVVLYDASGPDYHNIRNLADDFTDTLYTRELAANDFVYIGYDTRFNELVFDLGTAVNNNVVSMALSFHNGDDWEAVAGASDGTAVGGATMAQDGTVSWTMNYRWNRGSTPASATEYAALDQDLFWVKMDPSGAIDPVDVNNIFVTGDPRAEELEDRHLRPLVNIEDASTTAASTFTLLNEGRLYIACDKQFDTINWSIKTGNSNVKDIDALYWNGAAWTFVSITDNTASGGAALAQSGTMTFTIPDGWEPGTAKMETGTIGDYVTLLEDYQNMYFLKLYPAGDLTAVTVYNVTCENSDTTAWRPLSKAKDGETGTYEVINWKSTDYLYFMAENEQFNKIYLDVGTVNTVTSTMTAQYWNGYAWTAVTITDGTSDTGKTLAKDGAVTFTPPYDWHKIDIQGNEGYAIRLISNASLLVTTTILDSYLQFDNAVWMNVPALAANTWTWVEIDITTAAHSYPLPDYSAIKCVGFKLTADLAAQVIRVHNDIHLIRKYVDYVDLPNDEQVISLERYGEGKENAWAFGEKNVWELQFDNDNAPVAIPLRELQTMQRSNNGQAHTVQDVYIVFNMGERIERYYQRNLDDIGPDRDEGLPENRQGDVVKLVSYPGRLIAALDAGSSGFSTILVRKDSGWHEMYRAPYGVSIHDINIQPIEDNITRLWIAQGSDIVWLPLPIASWNPNKDSNFRFCHESTVTTGWIDVGFLDIEKLFKSVKLFTEDLSATHQYVTCEYQEEDGELESGWTYITSTFTTSPFQEINVSSAYDIVARRIRFRFHLYTDDNTKTPVIKAMVIESLLRFPVKYTYTIRFLVDDFPANLVGGKDMTVRAEDLSDQLETWADAPTALTMRCSYSPFDNKMVVLEPPGIVPIELDPDDQIEVLIAEATLLEI